MIPFKIFESFDKPYSYTWTKIPNNRTGDLIFYSTFNAAGKKIAFEMSVINVDDYTWEVSFGKDLGGGGRQFSLTKDGDSFRVIATVITMIGDAVKISKKETWYNIDTIYFSADKDEYDSESGEDVPSGRSKLYQRLVKKYAGKIGTVRIKDSHYATDFLIKVR